MLIKAAFGGGGRGMKVVRLLTELDDAFASAVRESTTAFGRGECFVKRFLERARHLETQCLADDAGKVVDNPYLAAEHGYIDAVIRPSETRLEVAGALRRLRDKRPDLAPRKHGNIPL